MQMIGYLGHSLSTFFALEPVEIIEIIDIQSKKTKAMHELQYLANLNALGMALGGRDFEYIDAFSSSKNDKSSETYTDDEVEFLLRDF